MEMMIDTSLINEDEAKEKITEGLISLRKNPLTGAVQEIYLYESVGWYKNKLRYWVNRVKHSKHELDQLRKRYPESTLSIPTSNLNWDIRSLIKARKDIELNLNPSQYPKEYYYEIPEYEFSAAA